MRITGFGASTFTHMQRPGAQIPLVCLGEALRLHNADDEMRFPASASWEGSGDGLTNQQSGVCRINSSIGYFI